MADRVHPLNDSDVPALPTSAAEPPAKPVRALPSGTYVIQIPKDQVYRIPPPEDAKRYEHLARGGASLRRNPCRRCICCSLIILLSLLLLSAVAAAVFYFVFRPESPRYSINSVSIRNFNLTSPAPISPEFDVAFRAENPNDKLGIDYVAGSSVSVYYEGVKLCSGALPVFYQGTNNVTTFVTALTGSGIELSSAVREALVAGQRNGTMPFKVELRAPVKIKVGSVKTWKITVRVNCDVTVDRLTTDSKIVSKDCDYGVDLW